MPDILEVELRISEGNAQVVLGRNKQSLEDFASRAEKLQPEIKFKIPNQSLIDLDKLEKRADETRKSFEEITKTRLDSGSVGFLTKEIVKTSERARQLQTDITGIKRELANPNRKSSIAFLTDELRAAEKEAVVLGKRLETLNRRSAAGGAGAPGAKIPGYKNPNLSFYQKQNLFYQANDVATMAAMGANPTQIIASQAGQIAQIFNPAQVTAFTAAYGGLVTVLGAGAAAIALTYKITGDIRAEAERRLKAEEMITAAINKQRIAQRDALKELTEAREKATRDFQFNQNLPNKSLDELKRDRDLLLQINQVLPKNTLNAKGELQPNEKYQENVARILELESRMRQLPIEQQKAANDAFNSRWDDWKKSQEDAIKAEEKHNAQLKVKSEKLLKLKDDFRETFVSLMSNDNPLVKQMSDLETVTERAQKKFGEFGDSVVRKIADIEKANLEKAIGLQKFENNFEALKFRQEAQKLASTPERQFADFQRKLDLVDRKIDFTANSIELDKKIAEADFYAERFNPNNPKSFNESRFTFSQLDRFGSIAGTRRKDESQQDFEKRRKEAIENGIKIQDAIKDINQLQGVSLEGTGIYGKNAVAEKILAALPSREDLLKRLESPFVGVREQAQFLLSQQSDSLLTKREFEQQKFRNFLEDQKTAEFGKQFANEQIGLINQDKTLTEAQKAQRRLSVTDALGNDLDATLKRQKIQDFVASSNDKENQAKEAMQIAKDTRDTVKGILDQLAKQGIKIDASTLPASTVNLNIKTDSEVTTELKPAATAKDVQKAYDDSYKGGTFFEEAGN